MSQRGWLTGNTVTATEFICRRVRIPNDLQLIMAVNGALLDLVYAYNWEKYGIATPEQTAALMQDMFYDYIGSNVCMIGTIQAYATVDPPPGCLPCDGSQYSRVDYPQLYERLDPLLIVDADTFQTPDLRQRHLLAAGNAAGLSPRNFGDVGGEEAHELTEAELAQHTHTADPHSHTNAPHTHTSAPHTHTSAPHSHIDAGHTHIDLGHSHSDGIAVPSAVTPGELPVPIPTATPGVAITGVAAANIQSAAANIQAAAAVIDAAAAIIDDAGVVIDDQVVTLQTTGDGEAHNNMPPFYVVRYCIVAR